MINNDFFNIAALKMQSTIEQEQKENKKVTSKEALIILRAKGVIDTRYCRKVELNKCLDAIEKDLEILEIIKNTIDVDFVFPSDDGTFYLTIQQPYLRVTKEQYELIKEALENV